MGLLQSCADLSHWHNQMLFLTRKCILFNSNFVVKGPSKEIHLNLLSLHEVLLSAWHYGMVQTPWYHEYIKHWKGNVVILTTFSSLDQRHWKLSFSSPAYDENVGAASDENLTKMTMFSLQWRLNNVAVISQTTPSIIHFLELKMLDMPTGVSNWLRGPGVTAQNYPPLILTSE